MNARRQERPPQGLERPPPGLVKICGLSTPDTLEAAIAAGADLVGLVRFPRSPRHVELEAGRTLSRQASGRVRRVLLMVDPTDSELDESVEAFAPDMIQLHGREPPERAAFIGARTGRPIVKALGIAEAADLAAIARYRDAAEAILLDAKPPRGADRPGGNGAAFDWTLLSGIGRTDPAELRPSLVLSGGLTPENVAEAIGVTGLGAVDVSSGVESRPGLKDPDLIRAFVAAARAGFAAQDAGATIQNETRRVA